MEAVKICLRNKNMLGNISRAFSLSASNGKVINNNHFKIGKFNNLIIYWLTLKGPRSCFRRQWWHWSAIVSSPQNFTISWEALIIRCTAYKGCWRWFESHRDKMQSERIRWPRAIAWFISWCWCRSHTSWSATQTWHDKRWLVQYKCNYCSWFDNSCCQSLSRSTHLHHFKSS